MTHNEVMYHINHGNSMDYELQMFREMLKPLLDKLQKQPPNSGQSN